MRFYSIAPRKIMQVNGYEFLPFSRNLSNKFGKKLIDTATKTGADTSKSASKKVVHRIAEATEELIGNETAEKVVKPKPMLHWNLRAVNELVIPPEKREKTRNIKNELRQVL